MNIQENVRKELEKKYQNVDKETGLYSSYLKPNYHSNMKPGVLHMIRDNTYLAASTFGSCSEEYYADANEIIRKVISCQCTSGECAGLWPYFYEESLEEMVAPDWNMADFNAYPMLVILKEHKDKLESGMFDIIKEACILACKAIIRRNLTPLYTNPTVMEIYILAVCGELFNIPKFVECSKNKVRKFYFLTMKNGTYAEYNCAGGYTKLILEMYGLILRHVNDGYIIERINELNNLAWTMIAEHYHYATGEFAGPKSREYTNFLNKNEQTVYQMAIGDGLNLIKKGEEVYSRMDIVHSLKCPEKIKHYFTDPNRETEFRRILTYGHCYPYLQWPLIDTQYIKPQYTLGSFNGMDGWNQHINVVSYIGDKNKKICIRMRVYHDGYDFAAAFLSTAQDKGTAMTVVNFRTDKGDTHDNLDPIIDAKIKAKDLRVRYQIEGNTKDAIDEITISECENGCMIDAFGVPVEIKYHYAEMSSGKPYFEIVKEENSIFVDMVLYSGDEKIIDLDALQSLVTVSHISVNEKMKNNPEISKDSKFIYVKNKINGIDAEIKSLYKPDINITSVLSNEIKLNNENIIQYVEEII